MRKAGINSKGVNAMKTFRQYLIARNGTVAGSVIDKPARSGQFKPTEKRSGDLVLGAGYKWSVAK